MNESIENFKTRFNKALSVKNIRPAELAEKTGLSKSTISHYMSGYTKPKSDKLFILAKALDVSEPWLMGYDAPMERNDYKDPNLLMRDAELEDIEKILELEGYSLCCENYDDDFFIVKNSHGQIITNFYDYELLPKYESIKKKGKVTAELLLSFEATFLRYLESLGYRISIDDPEHKPIMSTNDLTCRLNQDTLDTLKLRIDSYAKATVDSELLALKEEELKQKRFEKEKLIQHLRGENIYTRSQFNEDRKCYLDPVAAHERTDIEVTEEMKQHDKDFMMDPKNWKK